MIITINKHYNLHVFIFLLLSVYLFILVPATFLPGFLAVAVCIGVFLHLKKIEFVYKRWYEIIVFVIVNAYLAFAIFGFDLFLANTLYKERFLNLLIYSLGFIWTSYVLQSFLLLLKRLSDMKINFCSASNGAYWRKWLMLFAIMGSLFLIWQRAYNPAVVFPDTYLLLEGWLNNIYVIDYGVPFQVIISWICSLAPTKPEIQWIVFVQIIIFSSLLATILMYFHSKWIRFRYILPVAIVLPLIPSFGLHAITIMLDLQSSIPILWLVYILIRILDEELVHDKASKNQKLSFRIQLCICMAYIYFARGNTFVIFITMVPILIVLFSQKKNWGLLGSICLSIIFVLLMRYPPPWHSALNTNPAAHEWIGWHKYYAGLHDIQATYYDGGDLSEKTLDALKRYITRIDDPEAGEFRRNYVRYGGHEFRYILTGLTTREFLSIYVDSFIRNPTTMIKSVLHRVRPHWVIYEEGGVSNINVTLLFAREPDLIGAVRQSNALTDIMDSYIKMMVLPIPRTFIWRLGIWTALVIISTMTLILQKRFIWLLLYVPVFAYIVSLLLVCGWDAYRYGLPVFFVGMFIPLALLLTDTQTQLSYPNKKILNKGNRKKRY